MWALGRFSGLAGCAELCLLLAPVVALLWPGLARGPGTALQRRLAAQRKGPLAVGRGLNSPMGCWLAWPMGWAAAAHGGEGKTEQGAELLPGFSGGSEEVHSGDVGSLVTTVWFPEVAEKLLASNASD